jgi:hypothetical protein
MRRWYRACNLSSRGGLMATAAKFRIDVSIEALLMKSNQLPPAKATVLTLLEPAIPHLEEEWQCHF